MTSFAPTLIIAGTAVALALTGLSPSLARTAREATTGPVVPGTNCPMFPADNFWNTPITDLPVQRHSAAWTRHIGNGKLHPDFGPAFGEQPVPYGIPVTVVSGGHPRLPVRFDYADESDRVRYPVGDDTRIEGGRGSDGDRHAIIVDSSTCTLFELYDAHPGPDSWTAGSGAVWNLRSNRLRPRTWTSADAAGLPILPGLLQYDEVRSGSVRHAIRFTAPQTRDRFVWPARHEAGSQSGAGYPPMGARFRLRRSFSMAGWSPAARVVLRAMRRYGLVLADNGAGWYFQGTSDDRWPNDLLDELKRIPSSAFEAVATDRMKISGGSGRAR